MTDITDTSAYAHWKALYSYFYEVSILVPGEDMQSTRQRNIGPTHDMVTNLETRK